MVAKIYLRAEVDDSGRAKSYRLFMRGTNTSELPKKEYETLVSSGDKIKWLLEKDSAIRSLTRIWSTEKKSKVFSKEPKKNPLRHEFDVEIAKTDREISEKYNIEFIAKDGNKVTIDPYIRIRPPVPYVPHG
jgi:hypothetical protein